MQNCTLASFPCLEWETILNTTTGIFVKTVYIFVACLTLVIAFGIKILVVMSTIIDILSKIIFSGILGILSTVMHYFSF